MRRIAIIPARGGSQRIPSKNIKLFLGKPILEYSIDVALNSGLFDTVMVSTDNIEICEYALRMGASVPFLRSRKNADNFATTTNVLFEVLNKFRQKNEKYDYACCLYPTAPFTTVQHLEKAFHHLCINNFDCVFPVLNFNYPIQRALTLKDKKIRLIRQEHLNTRSQDLPETYHDAGQFYWFNTKVFLDQQKLWTDNTGVIQLSQMEAHDIDTEEDWRIAEFKYALNHQTHLTKV